MSPQRIQRRRTAGWRKPENAVIVTRPSRWGNPFAIRPLGKQWTVVDVNDRSLALREEPQVVPYRADAAVLATRLFQLHTGPMGLYEYDADCLADLRRDLGGRDLCCWCPLPAAGEPDHCHAAVLLEMAAL